MADIELVIKIPEVYFEALKKTDEIVSGQRSGKTLMSVIYNAVANGTPLPKGHGRLVETNTIQSMAKKKAEDCFPEGRYYYGYRRALFDFVKDIDDIDDASIIIEADKESEDA